MSELVAIRSWRPTDDAAALTELLHAAYAPLAAAGLRFVASHQDVATTERRLASGHPFVGVLPTGEIVGTITLYPADPESPCELYRRPAVFCFGQFGVRPDLKGQGIGEQLLARAEQHAAELGGTILALDTAEGAARLRGWYERLGFRFMQHVQWDVTNYRSVVMSKEIGPAGHCDPPAGEP